jgi:hypothetical protein
VGVLGLLVGQIHGERSNGVDELLGDRTADLSPEVFERNIGSLPQNVDELFHGSR